MVAGYLKEVITRLAPFIMELNMFLQVLEKTGISLNLGLVQTAYANGASTDYITHKLVIIYLFYGLVITKPLMIIICTVNR